MTLFEVLLQQQLNSQRGGGGGTSNYEDLTNKPAINGITLIGDKSESDLGLASNQYVNDTVRYAVSQAITQMEAYTDDAIAAIVNYDEEAF